MDIYQKSLASQHFYGKKTKKKPRNKFIWIVPTGSVKQPKTATISLLITIKVIMYFPKILRKFLFLFFVILVLFFWMRICVKIFENIVMISKPLIDAGDQFWLFWGQTSWYNDPVSFISLIFLVQKCCKIRDFSPNLWLYVQISQPS